MTITAAPPADAQTMADTDRPVALDPITFEVIRHRLWAINDDQGRMAARLSASTTVYELNDFNAALLTADGRGLCSGAYLMSHATTVASMVQLLLAQYKPAEIHAGDLFYTNDPWCGALHANDGLLALPVFSGGRLVAWSVIVMHDDDVGSPVPGSLVVGAHDRFGEAALFPIFKLGNDFAPREDLLAALLRNSRIPLANEQNMRARVAALRTAHDRLQDLIAEYGVDTFVAAQEELIAYVVRVLRSRLREIPDGSWFGQTYHDHDGVTDTVYTLCCRVTKRGDHLVFDTAGTSPQAPGPINCTRLCLEGAILGSLLVTLCTDLPWVCGAVAEVFDLVAEDGLVNTAIGAAPVSMGSFMATFSTNDVVSHVMAKMLQSSSRYSGEAQATWGGGISGAAFAIPDRTGALTISLALDALGGGGARSISDGVDTGGLMESPATRISNIEVFENRAPLLHLYRRESVDSGGAGRLRGGAGLEYAILPHKAGGPGGMATMSAGLYFPAGIGLSGGLPNAAAQVTILRDSDVRTQFAAGRIGVGPEQIGAAAREVQPPKAMAFAGGDDLYVAIVAGGSGFGDPLRREPSAVAQDVRGGLVSASSALASYGVVLDDLREPDEVATERERAARRAFRISASHRQVAAPDSETVDGGEVLHPVSDTVEAVLVGDVRSLRCTLCHHRYCGYTEDHRHSALVRDRELAEVNPLNAHCRPEFLLREFSCPGCGTAIATEVQLRDEPIRDDVRFFAPAAAV